MTLPNEQALGQEALVDEVCLKTGAILRLVLE
jgi:hypothetical protein